MASPTKADLELLAETVRRVWLLNQEVDALTQERDALRREVEGYQTVLHLAVTQLRELTLRLREAGPA